MHSFFKSLASKNKSSHLSQNVSVSSPAQTSSVDILGRLVTSPSVIHSSHHEHQSSSSSSTPDIQFQLIQDSEFQLIYGYIGLHTELELDIITTSQSVSLIARELKSRGLESPLLFSTHALDISTEATHSLIKTFIHNQREFFQHLPLQGPYNLSAVLKWILSRYVNPEDAHGFLKWEQYSAWRDSEPTFGYSPRFLSTHFLSQLSPPVASLVSCLLDLFASASLRADETGMTVHKCANLFGSYIFGLESDKPFEHTYNQWLRYSLATEHLILAHIRDVKAQSLTGKVPLRMENCIKGYPSIIPSLTAPHPSAKLEKVARFRRFAPRYSPNLIATAGTWTIARSKTWDRLKPYPAISAAQYLNSQKAGNPKEPSKLLLSQSYNHLLNIGANSDLHDEEDSVVSANFEGPQRFRSLVEKEWSGFMARGFQPPNAKKLQFNLEESFNAQLKMKRGTMDWTAFSDAGFIGRETFQAKELEFNDVIQKSCATPSPSIPTPKRGITKKLMKTAKTPTEPSYDFAPVEMPPLSIDDNFFEAWADVLVASGWCRDEPKEVSWVLLHCKCKAVDHQDFEFRPSPMNPDGRNEEMWTLIEEVMPKEYQLAQQNASKLSGSKGSRRSFLRAIIRKDHNKQGIPDKVPFTSEVPLNFPTSSDSTSRLTNTSHSSSSQTLSSRSSFESSRLTRDVPTPRPGPLGRLRATSRKLHASRPSISDTSTTDTHGRNGGSMSYSSGHQTTKSDKWLIVSAAFNPQDSYEPTLRSSPSLDNISSSGFKQIEADPMKSYDRHIHYTSSSLSHRPGSSHSSGGTRTSDQDELVHDGQRLSGTCDSAYSSDFTVEFVERLVEPPATLAVPSFPSTSNISRVNSIAIQDHRPIIHSLGTSSAHILTSRPVEYHSNSTSMYSSLTGTPAKKVPGSQSMEILPTMRYELHKPLDSNNNNTLSSQRERLHHRQEADVNSDEGDNKENMASSSSSKLNHDYPIDFGIFSRTSLSIALPKPELNSSGHNSNIHPNDSILTFSAPARTGPSELDLNSAGWIHNSNNHLSSTSYSNSTYSNDLNSFNIGSDQHCWFASLTDSSPATLLSAKSQPPGVTSPDHLDFKSHQVSNIVDMFEKGLPHSCRIGE